MKKKIAVLTLVCLSTAFCIPAYAKESPKAEYTFRNIPWYSTKSDTEQIFKDEGFTIEADVWKNKVRRMSGIDFLNTMSGHDYVDGGGYVGEYYGVNVAGYDVSSMGASYIYTIDDSGNINKSDDDALFYFGWYEFDSNDYTDGEGVYNDLAQKLQSLYGDGTTNTDDDYFSTTTWLDEDSNQIRLLLGGKDRDSKYVTLGYMAAGADEKLDEMQTAIDAEKIANEASEREKNKEDVSGL